MPAWVTPSRPDGAGFRAGRVAAGNRPGGASWRAQRGTRTSAPGRPTASDPHARDAAAVGSTNPQRPTLNAPYRRAYRGRSRPTDNPLSVPLRAPSRPQRGRYGDCDTLDGVGNAREFIEFLKLPLPWEVYFHVDRRAFRGSAADRRAITERSCLLSRAEQVALIRRWQEHGDQEARERVLMSVIGLVRSQANRWQVGVQSLTLDDLMSAGIRAALRAIDAYDETRGTAPSTLIGTAVQRSIRCAVQDEDRLVRLPRYLYSDPVRRESASVHVGRLTEPDSAFVEDRVVRSDAITAVRAAVDALPCPLEREAVRLRYGLHDGTAWLKANIARRLGVGRSAVRAILQRAEERLRDLLREAA